MSGVLPPLFLQMVGDIYIIVNHLKNVVDFLTRPNTIKCATFSRRRHNISTNSRKMIFFRKLNFAYEIVHRRVLLDYGS